MKKYNELFGIIHEKWHDACETKTFDASEVEPGVPINNCVPTPNNISKYLGEVGATPKLLSLGIKKMGKETPAIISNGVFWKP